MLSGSPLSPHLHMFINLEALQTHTLGIFMRLPHVSMIDYELRFPPALLCGEQGVGLWGG